jgi:hypothetical protein
MKSLADIKIEYETNFKDTWCDDFGNPSAATRKLINESFSMELEPAGKGWVGWILHDGERIAYVSLKETCLALYNEAFNLRNEYVEAALEGAYIAGAGYVMTCQQNMAAQPSYSSYR